MPNQYLPEDPEENLRMENEFLRLKLQAELGAQSHTSGDLNPALENEFLKHIMAFEQNYANAARTKIFDKLGQPQFMPESQLNDEQIETELVKVNELLALKNIAVDFIGDYNARTQYAFITGELFDKETDDFNVPGMITHYTYEEFHPNHQIDIENRAIEFLEGWFNQKLDEHFWCFDNLFVLPNGRTIPKGEIGKKLKQIFESYTAFEDRDYTITDINFEIGDDTGLGHAEGVAKYIAVLENGEKVTIAGPFKLYMTWEYDWWSIFHIAFPGFEY